MPEAYITLTPVHWFYLVGVLVILLTMILRKDTPLVCIVFLFGIGLVGQRSLAGGIQTIFSSIIYAISEFREVIATIALITAFSKCLQELGSDALLIKPVSKIMKTPAVSWWILGGIMFVFSMFLWPSPAVALVGAMILPVAVQSGLTPLTAAMAMNLFGHGFALSYDAVIQGAPAISAGAADISTTDILSKGWPLFWIMGLTCVCSAFLIHRGAMTGQNEKNVDKINMNEKNVEKKRKDQELRSEYQGEKNGKPEKRKNASGNAIILAILTPVAFLADILFMFLLQLKGGDATSLVAGTAVLLMCVGAVMEFKAASLEKVTEYVTDGFLFAIRIFAPVIVIGAFFFLGGDGISHILGDSYERGILNDWALWLAHHAPLNRYMTALLQLIIGGLTGLDGSGFSGLPLTGALARTFGTATGASIPILACLGQISAIFIGGGTVVPWGLIPVAAICNVDPVELARRNMLPVSIGLVCTFFAACVLL